MSERQIQYGSIAVPKGFSQMYFLWSSVRTAVGFPVWQMEYFGLFVNGAEDVQQTGLSSSWVTQNDDELSLPNVDWHSP